MSDVRAITEAIQTGLEHYPLSLYRMPATIYNIGISGIRNFRTSPPWRSGDLLGTNEKKNWKSISHPHLPAFPN
jgi:hypothetical protein